MSGWIWFAFGVIVGAGGLLVALALIGTDLEDTDERTSW